MQIPCDYFALAKKFENGGVLKNELDQYGFDLLTEINILYQNEQQILLQSEKLTQNFSQQYADMPYDEFVNEYDLGLIADFSKILEFGIDGSGCPFCMDFNESKHTLRIIFWDDGELRWRIIADSLEDFFNLFEMI